MRYFEYDAVLQKEPDHGGAYVLFPWDLRKEFGKGRLRVHATFDGVPYDGSIVSMGIKHADGTTAYLVGVLKSIRTQLGKQPGDWLHITVEAPDTQ